MLRRIFKGGRHHDASRKEPLIDIKESSEPLDEASSTALPPSRTSSRVPSRAPSISARSISARSIGSLRTRTGDEENVDTGGKEEQAGNVGDIATDAPVTDIPASTDPPQSSALAFTKGNSMVADVPATSEDDIVPTESETEGSQAHMRTCSEILRDIEDFAQDMHMGAADLTNGNVCEGEIPEDNQHDKSRVEDEPVSSPQDEVESKIPMATGISAVCARILTFPLLLKVGLAAAAVGTVAAALALAVPHSTQYDRIVPFDTNVTVAFIGSSLLFVNDVPRLVETLSGGYLTQNSCIHARGSLSSIILTGNGMYYRWRTTNAVLDEVETYNGRVSYIYDFGACSVPQLMLGYDEDLSYANQNGAFYNDGNNPCIKDYTYYRYMKSYNTTHWDFVVLNEQTKRMAIPDARSVSLDTLESYYVPLLLNSSSIPVILQPHPFWSSSSNMTGLEDIPTFTSMIYEGAEEFAAVLKENLPSKQTPRIAPVGLAFLVVYEEDQELWEKMLGYDGIHSSAYGTFVTGCTIYATVYGKMPPKDIAIRDDTSELWSTARRVQESRGYPSYIEAEYLYDVVDRVAIKNYKPTTLSTWERR